MIARRVLPLMIRSPTATPLFEHRRLRLRGAGQQLDFLRSVPPIGPFAKADSIVNGLRRIIESRDEPEIGALEERCDGKRVERRRRDGNRNRRKMRNRDNSDKNQPISVLH